MAYSTSARGGKQFPTQRCATGDNCRGIQVEFRKRRLECPLRIAGGNSQSVRRSAPQQFLGTPQPYRESSEQGAKRNRHPGDSRQSQSQGGESCIAPSANLISCPIHEGLDEALGLELVLSRHHGEENLHRWIGQTK